MKLEIGPNPRNLGNFARVWEGKEGMMGMGMKQFGFRKVPFVINTYFFCLCVREWACFASIW